MQNNTFRYRHWLQITCFSWIRLHWDSLFITSARLLFSVTIFLNISTFYVHPFHPNNPLPPQSPTICSSTYLPLAPSKSHHQYQIINPHSTPCSFTPAANFRNNSTTTHSQRIASGPAVTTEQIRIESFTQYPYRQDAHQEPPMMK